MSTIAGPRILFAAAGFLALGAVARADDVPAKPRDATGAAEIGAQNRKPVDTPSGRAAKQTGPFGNALDAHGPASDMQPKLLIPGGSRL